MSEKLNLVYSNLWSQRCQGQKYLKSVYIFQGGVHILKYKHGAYGAKMRTKVLDVIFYKKKLN